MKRLYFVAWMGSHVVLVVLLGVALMLWGGGCSKKNAQVQTTLNSSPSSENREYVEQRFAKLPVEENKNTGTIVVYFDFDSDYLRPEEAIKLDALLGGMGDLNIDGHACVIGTDEYNIGLGLVRAEKVRKYLGRGDVNSYGETMCRAACESIDEAECEQCRKVEVSVK
jgi:outer membrane protein OmpA-like peptidoglycan-associated protein